MPDFIGIQHYASFMPTRNTEQRRRRASDRQYSACRITPARQPRSLPGEGCRAVWRKRSKVFHRTRMDWQCAVTPSSVSSRDILHRFFARVPKKQTAMCVR
jgi:hypothetical protein